MSAPLKHGNENAGTMELTWLLPIIAMVFLLMLSSI
jgi:hypothetical protein